jgi:hypothetical protein
MEELVDDVVARAMFFRPKQSSCNEEIVSSQRAGALLTTT